MTTSIMMVTYNRLELTKRMLESFFQNTDSDYRLIIVDNGSTDGTVEWLQQLKPDTARCQGVHFHFNEKNMGIAIGRNQGLVISDTYKDEWLTTIDNDIDLPANWLSECLDLMNSHPKLSVGLNFEGTNYPLITRNGRTFQYKAAGNLGTACAIFHRQLHELIGFFNTEYGLYGEEDADFFFRARIVGWEIGYLKNGVHFGEGQLDVGEYREFKTQSHKDNLAKFQLNCRLYMTRKTPYFIPFTMTDVDKTK
jgi:GT2 family glycosyltransferase